MRHNSTAGCKWLFGQGSLGLLSDRPTPPPLAPQRLVVAKKEAYGVTLGLDQRTLRYSPNPTPHCHSSPPPRHLPALSPPSSPPQPAPAPVLPAAPVHWQHTPTHPGALHHPRSPKPPLLSGHMSATQAHHAELAGVSSSVSSSPSSKSPAVGLAPGSGFL